MVLSGNTLYGTVPAGGTSNLGTVFKLDTDGSGWAVLRSFSGQDGGWPVAGLVLSGSTLYGITTEGGEFDAGTVFRLNTDGSGFGVLANLSAGVTGLGGNLALAGSALYASTDGDGSFGCGTVFRLNTDGTGFSVLKSFTPADGEGSVGGVTLAGGTLYGARTWGGPCGLGIIFSLPGAAPTPAPVPLLWQKTTVPGAGEVLVLAWTNSYFNLQAAPTAAGPYTNVAGATSPYAVPTGGRQMFFRLQAN